jgi:glycerophosphoryl diester phosphodiesterase
MILLDPEATPVVGHRGASGEYPENTMLSFDHAVAQGVDALEFDVRVSADGIPVVIHDASVDRTTNGSGAVRSLTSDQLRELDAGLGQRIPTLDEVLARYPDLACIVEIKETEASGPVLHTIRHHDASHRVLVGSFVHAALKPFAAAGVHRSASRKETAVSWLAARWGLGSSSRRFEAFTVPERYRSLRVVDLAFVRAARHVGKPVHVWTVDDPSDATRLRAFGVCGIITNYPARMRCL